MNFFFPYLCPDRSWRGLLWWTSNFSISIWAADLYPLIALIRSTHAQIMTTCCSFITRSGNTTVTLSWNVCFAFSDTNLLQDLSQASVSQGKLEAFAAHQRKDIDHALKCECQTTCSHIDTDTLGHERRTSSVWSPASLTSRTQWSLYFHILSHLVFH